MFFQHLILIVGLKVVLCRMKIQMLPCTGLVIGNIIPLLMQIVLVSSHFRQNVLQFVFFFFSRSAIKQRSRILIPKNVHWNALKMTTEISNFVLVILENARLKEVLSDYQKWRFQFQILQILQILTCNSTCRWKIPQSFPSDGWKCDDGNFHRRLLIMQIMQNHSVLRQSF